MSTLADKACIVTGATRGIGLAIARALLARQARVLLCARTEREVSDTVSSLQAGHPNHAFGSVCDVRRYEQVKSLFNQARHVLGGLDVLINNAGIGSRSHVEAMSTDEWTATIETNLTGVFYCCREAIPMMKQRGGGYIVNIGSLAGKNTFPGAAAYCASKFGLIGFTEAMMQEVRYDHIRVSYVMPGSVNTSFAKEGEQDSETTWKLLPEHVAQVVTGLLEMDPRALPSRVELRPSEPRK